MFSDTDKITLVLLNAMATSSVRFGCLADAIHLFHTLRGLKLEADSSTFNSVLKACGAITELEHGRMIHSLTLKTGFDQGRALLKVRLLQVWRLGDAEKAFGMLQPTTWLLGMLC